MNFRGRYVVLVFITLLSNILPVVAQTAKLGAVSGGLPHQDAAQTQRRELWMQHGRAIPRQTPAALRYRAYQHKMQMRALRAAESHAAGAPRDASATGWTPLGPAPLASDASGSGIQDYGWVSGRATAVAIDPNDSTGNTVYVGGAYGGVWKSTNAGPLSQNPASVNWTPVADDQPTLAIGSIAIQPQLSNQDPARSVILAGTGETNSSSESYYGLGILRSADAGLNWTLITQDSSRTRSFAGLGFSRIAFSKVNPTLAVAAAAGTTLGVIEGRENPVTINRGLYYSMDAGLSWNYAVVKDAGLTIDASSATSVVYNDATGQFFAALQWHGIYASSDGSNWHRLNSQPGGLSAGSCPASPTTPGCPLYRGELAAVPGRNELYFWYVDADSLNQHIWRSKDGGITWSQLNDDGITSCGDLLGGCGTANGVYNLDLAAVPDGDVTEIYAGAVNLYRCRITSLSPGCAGTGQDTFINLTHVYGCPPDFGSIAHLNPNQHGIAFLQINANRQVVMYFATDGGIYRALDGYTGLITGACGERNQFDNLNQQMGSITQLVSFSQHPTDSNTILAGAGDNGSPATSASQSSDGWVNVNAGDGGYNQINPDNPTEWFTANTDVSIQRCALGVDCRARDFEDGLVVSSATVGGDAGAFFTPFILDPQNSGELIVGTCRMWRGATNGTGFVALSDNFETGGAESCLGGEVNLVRAVAAGGIKSTAGLSNVIYAGTDGLGPLAPTGGRIWSTINASGGTGTWFDRTGGINPGGFPISAIAVDPSDATGKTAYVAIMGFQVSHIWKTRDAGSSWTDFSANLPEAPANTLLVDAASGTLYAGTDIGVFASSTGSSNWTEIGPPVTGGTSGYLPNTAVTALRMFNHSGTKKLRASTYGRGVWEFTLVAAPDFDFSTEDSSLTTFAGQSADFAVTLLAQRGYNSSVHLSCTRRVTPAPASCSLTPPTLTPSDPSARFIVRASGPVGDYLFNVHGAGTDANTIARDFALTLHVVDFNLSPPAPPALTTTQSNSSGPVAFQVAAAGAFNQTVTLACGGLPASATCNFQPSSTVSPVSGSPVSMTLSVGTGPSTLTGTYMIAIQGTTIGGPTRTQNLALTINAGTTNSADFAIDISNPLLTVGPNELAVFNGTLKASGGYSSVVNLTCSGNLPLTCAPSPASLTPTPAGTPFSVTTSGDVPKNYDFNIVAYRNRRGTYHQAPSGRIDRRL